MLIWRDFDSRLSLLLSPPISSHLAQPHLPDFLAPAFLLISQAFSGLYGTSWPSTARQLPPPQDFCARFARYCKCCRGTGTRCGLSRYPLSCNRLNSLKLAAWLLSAPLLSDIASAVVGLGLDAAYLGILCLAMGSTPSSSLLGSSRPLSCPMSH
ncbi:hypothetical protein DFH06DRAFT_1259782 [Mycena polygramma]|nr:hypothetical protein DFH06DRAFT_1259782 [Mycena polygramma]